MLAASRSSPALLIGRLTAPDRPKPAAPAASAAPATLPASWYTDQAHFELEQRAVFAQTWLYATHRCRFERPGDYLGIELGGYPLVLVLGEDGRVRAFHNVCRHRAAPVVRNDAGSARVIGCRYHGWSYNTKGELVKAPSFEGVEGFDASKMGLIEVHLHETSQGFLFANVASAPRVMSFDEHFPGLDTLLASGGFDFGQYKFHSTIVKELDINWKAFVDGFQECYHCEIVHPGLSRDFKLASYKVDCFTNYCRHHCDRKDDRKDGAASGDSDGMWLFVLPNLGLNCYSPCFSTQRAVPLSATRTRMVVEVFVRADTSSEVMDEFLEYMNRTDAEDYEMCLAAQGNLNKGIYTRGALHPVREAGVIYYQRVVRHMVEEHRAREAQAGRVLVPARTTFAEDASTCLDVPDW